MHSMLLLSVSAAFVQAVVSLTTQYRMAEDIQLLANQLIYNSRLRCGSEAVRTQCLDTHIPQDLEVSEWMMKVALI